MQDESSQPRFRKVVARRLDPGERWIETPEGFFLNTKCPLEAFQAAWVLARKRGDEQEAERINDDANRFHHVRFVYVRDEADDDER
jgi:hypothetical protein